jgi:hypothetical protein
MVSFLIPPKLLQLIDLAFLTHAILLFHPPNMSLTGARIAEYWDSNFIRILSLLLFFVTKWIGAFSIIRRTIRVFWSKVSLINAVNIIKNCEKLLVLVVFFAKIQI